MSVADMGQMPRRFRRGSEIAGAALVVVGVGLLLEQTGVLVVSRAVIFATALIVVGLGLVVIPVTRYGPAVVTGLVLTFLLAASTLTTPIRGSVGELLISPASTAEAQEGYSMLMGSMQVDLSSLEIGSEVIVPLNLAMGELIVEVPHDVEVSADVEITGGGEFVFMGKTLGSGVSIQRSASSSGFESASSKIVLDIHVGSGRIEVRRAGF